MDSLEILNYSNKWDERWKNSKTPWDFGEPALALVDTFNTFDFGNSGTALVPGCGGGYDATFIGSFKDWKAVGLDLSETAVETAEKYRDSQNVSKDRVSFVSGDFFSFTGQFDVVFDHTFLCAIMPCQRQQWADQMAALIKPNGYLIAYIFPINTHTDGPPWALNPEIYYQILNTRFKNIFIKNIQRTFEARKKSEHGELISLWQRV